MGARFPCGGERRRAAARTTLGVDGRPLRNGIDYLEVSSADQRTLEVVFLHPLPGEVDGVPAGPPLAPANLVIEGGVRVRGVRVTGVAAAGAVLTVTVDAAGDFSTYTLRLVSGGGSDEPPDGFDPRLAEVAFSFKAGCPSDFDCAPAAECPPERLPVPDIDYLAKDYASFRRLMLDRLSVTVPGWQDRNPADVGVTVVELLAYAADQLSYQQDAVAAEAYLGTARLRTSLRRHARLLDYPVHDGAAARAWVSLEVAAGAGGAVLPGPRTVEGGAAEDAPGTLFLTRVPSLPPVLDAERAEDALAAGALPFEALHDLTLRPAFSEIRFHTWGDEDCCLPRGATSAWLRDPGGALAELEPGRVLVFEEVRGSESGRAVDADPRHRHPVRLTAVRFAEDPLFPEAEGGGPGDPRLRVAEIRWDAADALPFPLCLRELPDPDAPGVRVPVSVARGNVVLVEHGITRPAEPLPPVPPRGRFRPRLVEPRLARGRRVATAAGDALPLDRTAGAARAAGELRLAAPLVRLRDADGTLWLPAPDLLDSGGFDPAFVVEAEEDGSARLRFGDGVHGRAPRPGTRFAATYRVGGGAAANVGAESIAHVVLPEPGIAEVRNPLPAAGGEDPEPLERVRLDAPQAFRVQERAVTEADYAAAAQRHPSVHHARATFRWTGSWHTVFLTVDRRGGLPVDPPFEEELRGFMERFPLAGYDLEVEPPRFVPLDLAFTVCVRPGYLRAHVRAALLRVLGADDLPDGRRGLFHPDELTFGQPVYLSRIVAAIMETPGVRWVDAEVAPAKPNRFCRWGEPPRREWEEGVIRMGRLEIARLDNDPSVPENGRLELIMEGGA